MPATADDLLAPKPEPLDLASDDPTSPPRYEFCSDAWLAAVHATLAACVAVAAADHPELTFSMSETSLNPPARLALGEAGGGWSCFVRNGRIVHFRGGGSSDAEYQVEADYALMADLSRMEMGGDAERAKAYRELTASLWRAGLIRTVGQTPRLPKPFNAMHDLVARFTA